MQNYDYCIIFMTLMFAIFLSYIRDLDENNMDSYDRRYGNAGEGRTRGALGTIYDSEGNIDYWRTFTDHNPYIY